MELSAQVFEYNTSVVSQKQYAEHLKLYNGYIVKFNEIWKDLLKPGIREAANSTYSEYRGLKRGESYALDGIILHEGYFQNMSNTAATIGPKVNSVFEKFFDGYKNWEADFKACAKSARGWCIFAYEQRTRSFMNILLDSHDDGNISMSYPIIILDMYEHSYFLDYGTDKSAYINKFIEGINWGVVEQRMNMLM